MNLGLAKGCTVSNFTDFSGHCQTPDNGDPVRIILRHPLLADGPRIVLFWLWALCGMKPNRIVTSKQELAWHARHHARSIERHLETLQEAGSITIEEWNHQSGAIVLFVWHPSAVRPAAKFDPQQRLAFEREEFATEEVGQVVQQPQDVGQVVQQSGPVGQLVQGETDPEHIIFRARVLCSDSDKYVVVDDDRRISFDEAWGLVEDVERLLWPNHRAPDRRLREDLYHQACVALLLFNRDWILTAAANTRRKASWIADKNITAWSYFVGCLRNGLKDAGFVRIDRDGLPSWFGRLMQAASKALGSPPTRRPQVSASVPTGKQETPAPPRPPMDPVCLPPSLANHRLFKRFGGEP